jgi:PAS domain S-box-containing protein
MDGDATSDPQRAEPARAEGAAAPDEVATVGPALAELSEAARSVLVEDRERYRSLYAYHPQAVFSLDLEGRYTEANLAATLMTGRNLEELRRASYAEVIVAEDAERVRAAFEEVRNRKPKVIEVRIARRDGTVLEVVVTAVPVIVADEVIGVHGIAEDVTERNRLRRELEQATRLAEDANAAKGLFLANMSHEVRTPLTSIIVATELLKETPLDEVQRRFADIVERSSHTVLRLVEDILDFARLEAGRLNLDDSPLRLRTLLRQTVDSVAERAREKSLELAWQVSDDVPEEVFGDGVRLAQVLVNLLENAIKFTASGAVRLRTDVAERAADMATLRFAVEDSGSGISVEELESLFEPFTQGDPTPTRQHGGAGLGLAICRELAELMGGSIHAESTPGHGSTFTLVLPMRVQTSA